MKIFFLSFFICSFLNLKAAVLVGKYELTNSSIHYQVKYLIKKADGKSTQSRGKGECTIKNCDFIVAAPIKSFESKDASRDLNMLKTLHADQYPLVSAKIKTNSDIQNGKIKADVEIDFVGIKKSYSNVELSVSLTDSGFKASGVFDLLLDEHKIEKPSLLGVSIESSVPVTLESDWKLIK